MMQRRIAWLVREYRRIGNWSGVGSGKTISALLSSRISHIHLTLIITNYPTISGWVQSIRNVYPDSQVYVDPQAILHSDRHQYRYLVLNYEKFQGVGRHQLVQQLLMLGIQFIVLDEIQLVKQRETQVSQRSKAVETLIRKTRENNADLRVLGMSATPIINSLLEGKRLLEMTTGASFSELGTSPTIANALGMHRALMRYGFRFCPRYEQEMRTTLVTVKRNDLLPTLELAQSSVLAMEQVVLPAKLDAIESYLRPGTLIYTHYVEGMLPLVKQHLAALGFSMGFYTGSDKSGLQPFLDGRVEILIGSSAVGIGIDGLQQRCDRILFLSLPWTSAAFEQIIGRARRQGSRFKEVEIIIPRVILEEDGKTWSWDEQRWSVLQSKRTLSDCVLDGRIPDMIRLNEQTLLRQSSQALQHWIERVRKKEAAHRSSRYKMPDDAA
jgi:hypothetical protein